MRLLLRLPHLEPVAAEPSAVKSGFGTLGRLALSEVLHIDFCVLPPAEAARPLWGPFSAGAVGALMLDGSESALRLARYLAWEVRVPVVAVGQSLPPALRGAPGGAHSSGDDVVDALRTLLVQAINPPVPGAGAHAAP